MALPTVPEPTRLSTDFVFVYVAQWSDTIDEAADVTDWGDPLPNVVGHSASEDANDEEWRHYGTGAQVENVDIEYPVSLSLEASANISELGRFLGYTVYTNLSLKDSTKVHIAQVGYKADGTLVEVEYWSKVAWTSLASSGSAGTSATYKSYELSGKANEKYLTDGSESAAPKAGPARAPRAASSRSKKD